jgi:hypothetical protein
MRHTAGPGCAIQLQRLTSCYFTPGIIAPAMEKAGGRSRPKRVGQWHPRGGGPFDNDNQVVVNGFQGSTVSLGVANFIFA